MNAPDDIAQGRVNRPVPRHPRQWRKGRCRDGYMKMALAALTMAGMAAVLFAFVPDFQTGGGKSCGQAGMYFVGNSHFTLSTPVIS